MNCTSRLSLCDMGWHECQLEQNHKGSHKFVDKEDGYTLTWKRDKYKDTNVTTEWLRKNTNLFEIIDKELINFKDHFSGYEIDESFNGYEYGDNFSLWIHLCSVGDLKDIYENWEDEKFENFMKNYFINKYGEYNEYDNIEWDFYKIVKKQIKPNLDKYKLRLKFNII